MMRPVVISIPQYDFSMMVIHIGIKYGDDDGHAISGVLTNDDVRWGDDNGE